MDFQFYPLNCTLSVRGRLCNHLKKVTTKLFNCQPPPDYLADTSSQPTSNFNHRNEVDLKSRMFKMVVSLAHFIKSIFFFFYKTI